jgi:hypothetical protein
MRIKAYYENIDKVIASVKAKTVKYRTISNLFIQLGKPLIVIVTRWFNWSSWSKASLYYSKTLLSVKKIVYDFPNDGILLKNTKEAIIIKIYSKRLWNCVAAIKI